MKIAPDNTEINLEWRAVHGYEGLYEVSNTGKVRRLNKRGVAHELRLIPSHLYFRVDLSRDGKVKHFQVHRLVATAFLDKPANRDYIDHINGNGRDNRVENLRWCTMKENNNNPITRARRQATQRVISTKPERRQQLAYANRCSVAARIRSVQCIESGETYASSIEASAALGIPVATINTSCWREATSNKPSRINTAKLHFKYI